MKRKGEWEIKKWMDSDLKAAQLFNCICNVSKKDAMAFSGVSDNRIHTYLNLHYIEKLVDKRGNPYYRTTPEGRKMFEEKTGIRGYASNSYNHDKALYDVYVERTDEERNTWQTETEQRRYAEDHGYEIGDTSVCDGAYRDSETGEIHYVEIVSPDYPQAWIDKKIAYVNIMGGTYEQHNC